MTTQLPPVAPGVTAGLVAALSPRLRKRLDTGVAKLAGRPAVRDGDTVRIALDDTTELLLHVRDGAVTSADAIRCGCLLAPDCLHRATVASAAPIALEEPGGPDGPAPAEQTGPAPGEAPGPAPADTPAPPATDTPTAPGASSTPPHPTADAAAPDQCAASAELFRAAAAVLEAGTDGTGAVLQAELLRAAHGARLAGLPRAAAAAVSTVSRVRAARAAEPAHRLADLVTDLRDLLLTAWRLPHVTGPELAALRGTARQTYTADGSLRLYGLFSEPVLTAGGNAGAVTWTADGGGRRYTVSDIAPGGPARATGAADRAVRMGDTALTHRELSRAGLAVSGATVSPTGRLGAGAGVRAVRAAGAGWHEEPLDRLWGVPPAEQAERALAGGDDLLFLDVTLLGAVREAVGDCLLADCGGLTVRLTAAHDHPGLPYRDNLRLLAAAPGLRLRTVARLDPAPHARARLLAVSHPTDPAARVDLGLDRLRRADLPATVTAPAGPAASCTPDPAQAPLHVLRRRLHQVVAGGRRVLTSAKDAAADARRLRGCGLATAADLVDGLHAAAADRSRDVFGRLLPADGERFARTWLGAAVHADAVDRSLCAAAWGAGIPLTVRPPADPR
ncbi:hypothetical protein BJP40_12895 [Streptomyces sp. CC53]|uniref:hypothetical protein n=1 Tax=unclassified Streptomyces TaxID=2593676 RepID=UPI0008DD5E49|nr:MULTISPECIES: hypothetical protein [unclassified Streptomyces]OII59647.1 hypothetical protein BJP40_12895 [Streptomyces sp. CC53]